MAATDTQSVTFDRLTIIDGHAYGKGTYEVPLHVARTLEARRGGFAVRQTQSPRPAGVTTSIPEGAESVTGDNAPAAPIPQGQAGADHIEGDDSLAAYRELLDKNGYSDVSKLKGLSPEEIQKRLPGLTPVGAAKIAEAAG